MPDMTPVSDALEAEVRSELSRRGIVIWLDRDRHYTGFVDDLARRSQACALAFPVLAFNLSRATGKPSRRPRRALYYQRQPHSTAERRAPGIAECSIRMTSGAMICGLVPGSGCRVPGGGRRVPGIGGRAAEARAQLASALATAADRVARRNGLVMMSH
jgi:hypothetical protein